MSSIWRTFPRQGCRDCRLDDAATVLGTKGHIILFQGKVSIPINDVLKVAVSATWSNRSELIPDSHTVRGQVDLAVDLDGVFK